uniref:sigma factor-like helix-turn-helix DNA-binding protein n=1 Tax=Paractinoplanes polyasparticus TaxID=2856853 RepID=UPI001C85EA82|nr:sigma factor-like helix-turn-helix DNA-binding protein [Actinoplanes polyasparticus]
MIEIRQRWFSIDNHEAYAHTALRNRIGRTRESVHAQRTDLFPIDELPARPDPGQDIENYAGVTWVNEVLSRLPPTQRKVMQLLVSGLKYRDIAEELA